MKPEITEFTAVVDGAECVFRREPKREPPSLVVLPAGYDVSFDAREAWTVIEPGGRELRVKVPRGSDVEWVREAAATEIRARNAMAFEILRGHLVGDWSGVYDHAFHEVYMAAGAERLLRGGGRHQRGMKSFA